ncbi:MAG TPA: DsrE family protein [Puia sp.]
MKRILVTLFLSTIIFTMKGICQAAVNPDDFHGATAEKSEYKVVYQLDNDDDKVIKTTIRNIQNALEDPRLKGKLRVELVVHGAGVAAFMKSTPYDEQFKRLQSEGVLLAQCLNTMREKNLTKDQLLSYISFVPSGTGELIIRQQQGWAYVHP